MTACLHTCLSFLGRPPLAAAGVPPPFGRVVLDPRQIGCVKSQLVISGAPIRIEPELQIIIVHNMLPAAAALIGCILGPADIWEFQFERAPSQRS
jgi:hypothetical protein